LSSLDDEPGGKPEQTARTTSAFDAHASFQARQTSFFEAAMSSLLRRLDELKASQGVSSEEWTERSSDIGLGVDGGYHGHRYRSLPS
jgi:hypothetical protein